MRKGLHTKKNVWDVAADLTVIRDGQKLEPGVNYFVLMLDQMEMPTRFSCEGHPNGFYITFNGSYRGALAIRQMGYFSVEIEGHNYWSMRSHINYMDTPREKVDAMRWAAEAWERGLGPLDLSQVMLEM